MLLTFTVRNQTLTYRDTKLIPRIGSSNYLQLRFIFVSKDWNNLRRTLQISAGEYSESYILESDSFDVPPYYTQQESFNITLLGDESAKAIVVPTNVVTVMLDESNTLWTTTPPDPQSSAYLKVLESVGDLNELKTKDKSTVVDAVNEVYEQKLNKNQGVDNAGKALVVGNDGNVVPGKAQGGSSLPVASPTQLGGVKPVAKTDTMTRGVGVDTDGGLYTEPGAWYVTVTQAFSDSVMATADKTAAEVYAAYQAGYAVYARVRLANVRVGFYVLPLVACIPNGNGGVATLGFSVAGQQSSVETPKVIWVLFRNNQWVIVSTDLAGLKDIPTALPNPNALAIKVGDTTTTYDGSAAKTVEVPDGNNPLGITSATVGQIPKITAVDASGVPTAWSPVDMSGGEKWEKLIDTSLAESVESVTYTFDDCKRIKALIAPVIASDESVFGWKRFTINNVSYPSLNNTMRSYEGICLRIDSEYPPYVQANANTNTKLSVNGLVGGAYTAALENIAPNGITEFGCQTAEILKAGTKIEIWGVKS